MLNSKPLPGTPINPLHPLARGLVGYWLLNDGGKLAWDYSGNGNHGLLTNMHPPTDYVGSKFGTALEFDGVNDYVLTTFNPNIDIGNENPFTISVWAYPRNVASNLYLVSGSSGNRFYFGTYTSQWFWGIGNTYDLTTGVAATNNIWQYVVLVFEGSSNNVKIYLNGILEYDELYTGTANYANVNTLIGAYSPANNEFNGLIDNVSIYNRVLLAQEVQQLFIAPFGMFKRPSVARYFVPTDGAEVYSGRGIGRGILRGVIR